MEKSSDALQRLAGTLEKYKKNKTLVSPEDLKGKYKVPFEKLKAQLRDELTAYLIAYSLEGLVLVQDDQGRLEAFAASVNRIYSESGMAKRIGRAAFGEFDIEKVKALAEELRIRIYKEAWVPYFQRHTCLYTTEACLAEDNPQTPRIYNSLVDKFWDKENSGWIRDEAARKPAILMYISEKGETT